MRKLLAPFACLAFLVATAVFAGTTPPEKATIDACVAKKAAVEFPHKAHVDGGIAWSYAPSRPRANPPVGSPRELLKLTQVKFWAVRMGRPPAYDPVVAHPAVWLPRMPKLY